MKMLQKLIANLLKVRQMSRVWRYTITALACVVIFSTTYAMILPAITVDKDTAEADPAIVFEEVEESLSTYEVSETTEPEASETYAYEVSETTEPEVSETTETEVSETAEPEVSEMTESAVSDTYSYEVSETTADEVGWTEETEVLSSETEETAETEEDTAYTAAAGNLTYDGDDYRITVTYGESANLPADAELLVEEIYDGGSDEMQAAYDAYYEKSIEAVREKGGDDVDITFARYFDISIMYDGRKLEPEDDVDVKISYSRRTAPEVAEQAEVKVVHFEDDGADARTLSEQKNDVNVTTEDEKLDEVTFKTDGFSVYGVVGTTYTVDFHFEVNGKALDYSIPGGGFITLSQIAKLMGFVSDEFSSEECNAFIEQIESVKFSDPALISVSKVSSNSTVGDVKRELGIECKYSKMLTETDISDINTTEVIAPDWILISLKPFASEETLTVIMKDGQAFSVQVTDAQMALNIHSSVVDTNGNNIHLSESLTNQFTVYQKTGEGIDGQEVKDLNVGFYSIPADYTGYSEFRQTSVTTNTNGTGMVYVYDVSSGMYFIQENKNSVPDTITDSAGHTWKYVGTRIETEYVWRQGANDGGMHFSDTCTKDSGDYNSIPEVVGPYKNYANSPAGHEWDWDNNGTWEALSNGFLDFYVYNIYEPQSGNLRINKTVTVNNETTNTTLADGTYTFELWNADGTEQITKTADGTAIGDFEITVVNGHAEPIAIEGLNGGTYIVRETGSTNTATMEMTDKEDGYDAAMRGIVVTVSEDHDAEVTFVNDYSSVAQTVKKIWEGEDIPSSLTVTLFENEVATSHTVTLSADNGWSDTIEDLPKYKDGKPVAYFWVEGNVPSGYFITGYEVVEMEDNTTTTITNTYRKYEFTTFYEGTKEWFDDDDAMGARPEALRVTLYASYVTNPGSEIPVYGEPEATFFEPVWTKEGNHWTFRFENIPVFDENGEVIIYTSGETAPGGYEKTENVTPTEYSLGTFVLESGHQRVTPNSTLTKYIESLIDLPVLGIKKGGVYIIWSPRTPTPREEQSAREALAREAHSDFRYATWYVDSQIIPTDSPENTVTVNFDPEAARPYVSLRFNYASAWSWFVYGTFNGGESKYQKGTAEFTNTLTHVTPELTGTKIWDIVGDEVPDDPILRLTRTVTITPEEGEPYTSAPEMVDAVPTWSGEGKTRTFTYHELPKYDLDGNEYIYHVAETSFTVNGVIYTTVRHSDGTYTVTASDETAPTYVTTQVDEPIEGSRQLNSTITNVESTKFSFSKIWYNNDNEIDIWPADRTITVVLNAFTADEEKALKDVEVTLSPFNLPSGWEVSVNGSGTRTTFSTSGLPTTKDGKPLTYYIVETQVDGYQPPVYQTGEGTPTEDGDKALNGQQVVNIPVRVPVELTKIGDWTVGNKLSGVQFKVFADENCTELLITDSDENPIGIDGVITTDANGKATIGTFTPGTYYLQEVRTADGYNMLKDVVSFEVKADGTVDYSTGNISFDSTNGATYENEGVVGIYINNPSGIELPNTGGAGTLSFTLSGIALIMASALMYGFRMRRRERRLN